LAHEASGDTFQDSGYHILEDQISWLDTLGAKMKFSLQLDWMQWYVQGSYKGLVADGGPDGTTTFVGWSMKESGRGNQYSLLTGASFNLGSFRIAPNFLYQKPIEGPLPRLNSIYNPVTGKYYQAVLPRNVQDDAFAVLDNRETIGFELLLAYDPTPGSWFWMWDNDVREDAAFAASLDFSYRIQPTSRDSRLAFLDDGTMFSFDDAPEAKDVWDVNARIIYHPRHDLRIISHLYLGQGQGHSPESRLITRAGGDARVIWDKLVLQAELKFNDWGPYDYHRDYDLTYPVQVLADLSYGLSAPKYVGPDTRFGLLYRFRSLDEHSPRYHIAEDQAGYGDVWGSEYELITYVRISL
jgi:beta-galactosidase